jgi:metal-responsive CopG/Arc/MetJ family transcriptional regulator
MHQQRVHVVLDDDLVARIDQCVGQRGRSRFLAEAARSRLLQLRQMGAISVAAGAWSAEDHPELADGAAAYLAAERAAADREEGA